MFDDFAEGIALAFHGPHHGKALFMGRYGLEWDNFPMTAIDVCG